MSKKLFCGGLAWATDAESLRAAFAQFGELTEASVALDALGKRSRGYGFVAFVDDAAADAAIAAMNGQLLDGRNIHVQPAVERTEPPEGAPAAPKPARVNKGGPRRGNRR